MNLKPYSLFPLFCQKLIWIPTRLVLIIFGHIQIEGLENLKDLSSPVIFACNHASELDAFLVPASLSFFSRFSPLFYATREKSFYDTNGWRKHLFGGLFINVWGGYTALTGLNDYSKSLAVHADIIRDGYSFCIFPEGGITNDGKIRPAKGGVSYLAETAAQKWGDCAVIPVGFFGAYKMSAKDFFMRKRKIFVRFGKPIIKDEMPNAQIEGPEKYKIQASYIMKKVGELTEK